MIQSANLGFPRIGAKRELKTATEAFWKGSIDAQALSAAGAELRARHWRLQKAAGIAVIPSNDFSFYDQVLDLTAMVGAIPPRFRSAGGDGAIANPARQNGTAGSLMELSVPGAGDVEMDQYFAMARGSKAAAAMEMTKWFDTNYHYLVPEFNAGQTFKLSSRKVLNEFNEAKALGIHTRPVLVGPVTYLMVGKAKDAGLDPLSLLDALLPVYEQILAELKAAGADWVQLDEPVLALDLSLSQRRAFRLAYKKMSPAAPKILVASYFGGLGDNVAVAADLPVAGHHVDLVRAPGEVDNVLENSAQGSCHLLGRRRRSQRLAGRLVAHVCPSRHRCRRAWHDKHTDRAIVLAAALPGRP